MSTHENIIYQTQDLVLIKNKQTIELLSTDNGFFKDLSGKLIGNIVLGYKIIEGTKIMIEPLYEKIIQVLPDNSTLVWVFTDGGYYIE